VTTAAGGKVLLMQQQAIDDNRDFLEEVFAQQKRGVERSYIARAIGGCTDLINDAEIEVTQECSDPRVAAYYPPTICDQFPDPIEGCGSKTFVFLNVGEFNDRAG